MTDIRTYIRNKAGDPIGILIAMPATDPTEGFKYHIGWSQTHKNDKFNKRIGLSVAVGRITKAEAVGVEFLMDYTIPHRIKRMLPQFRQRCNRFFK
jgi:hypothetical protein